ncbi:MAG: PqqD family protein [Syntrophobacteraceae bacterium]|jgi:hypothetical protein
MAVNPTRREDVMERRVGKDHMLYDATGRAVHLLNETALFVWERCDGDHAVQDIISEAESVYKVSKEQIQADVEECLAALRIKALLKDSN